ncbi:MAG: hypothetical protein AAB783_02315 [Patescibacteria group bacterium]
MSLRKNEQEILFSIPRAYPRRHKSAYLMAIFFLLVLGVGYISFRTSAIFIVPELIVGEPTDGATVRDESVKVRGTTESKARLTVNGYEAYSNEQGIFELSLPFQKGFHTIDVRVKNRIGKESRVVRHIVVE